MPATKRSRAASAANLRQVKAKEDPMPPLIPSASSQLTGSNYLDKLPSEIINEIWKTSREPCLIHTCRRFYQNIAFLRPDHQDYCSHRTHGGHKSGSERRFYGQHS